MINRSKNGPYDELYTPKEALHHLLPYLPGGIIWEPAPGTGELVKMLRGAGHRVVWKKRDFFEWQPTEWDLLVTNPPFSIKARWLQRCNDLGKPFALLLPVTSLGSRSCQLELVGSKVLFLPRRIDFTGKKAPWFSVAWFTKGIDLPHQMTFVE